ncbi:MAG: BON domain-containing protein [Chitinophagaceae bacterium]|nr:BON domain-containing protein [Oligoflexus sp.]
MKIPVNSKSTPAETGDRNVTPDPSADNSSRNSVHNGKNAVTADQASNDKSDVEITRQIRQSIVKDKSLSTNAHNVKIVTVKGRVVLKGPVGTNDEKAKIEDTAASVAGKDKVVSEIEVK